MAGIFCTNPAPSIIIALFLIFQSAPFLGRHQKILMKKAFLLSIFCIAIISKSIAQSLNSKLASAFQKFIASPSLKYASVGFSVLDSKSGNVVFARDENRGLAPASTLKVVTAATALDLLGPDFTYETAVAYTGKIEGNTLNGDLIITGTGDPTLGSERWEKTSKAQVLNRILFNLQQKGIQKINGKVIADASAWDTQSLPIGWIWQDMGNYYGAGTSALCWGENAFYLSFRPGKTAVELNKSSLTYPFLEIHNELSSGVAGSGDNVYAYSAPYTNQIFLRGTYAIDLKKDIGLSLPNPPLAMAYDVADFLNKNGFGNIGYQAKIEGASIAGYTLFKIQSPPLSEIVYWFNQKSINLYGEQMLRTLASKFGKSTSTIEGLRVLNNYWGKKGISEGELNIGDGSGLSPANRASTLAMAKVLAYARQQVWFDVFYKSIPLHNQQKMKSGTIADVLAYCGYAGEGQNLSFSIMVNNYQGSTTQMRQQLYRFLDSLK